jgi:rhodanese-related sulfurtransferase
MATDSALRDHLLALFQQTREDVAAFVASRSEHDRAAHDLIALIGFWMEYNVERIGYFARGETPPRDVDFDALTQAALTENAYRSWAGSVAYTEVAFDHLAAAVAASPEALLLANNVYGDDPGGPSWGEISANGFTWPLQEMEKLYLASGDTARAAELRARLTREHGEEEQPIVCDLLEPAAVQAQRGDLLVIDVRGASEFAAGHLPGARNIPLAALPDRLGELPRDQPILTYCNMQHPGHSRGEQAAALLSERGYHAAALAGGYPGWRAQGLPSESGGE